MRKSTLINYLRGTVFIDDPDDPKLVIPSPDSRPPSAPMGTAAAKGRYCTVYPAVYVYDPDHNLYIVDSQGFYGHVKDPDLVTTAAIMLNTIVQAAASVRIVYLEDAELFQKGATAISETEKLLNSVLLRDDVELFFLFNKFNPSKDLVRAGWYSMSPEQQYANIMERLQRAHEQIVQAAHERIEELRQRATLLESRLRSEGLLDETANSEETETRTAAIVHDIMPQEDYTSLLRFAGVLEFNFSRGHFGYFDPQDAWFAEKLRAQLQSLPVIEKSALNFGRVNQQRAQFGIDFERVLLTRAIPLLTKVIFAYKYNPAVCDALMDTMKAEINQHNANKQKIGTEEQDQVFRKYNLRRRAEIERHTLTLLQLHQSQTKTETKRQEILDGPPVEYYSRPFIGDIGKWIPSATVTYVEPYPIFKISEELTGCTVRKKFLNFPSDDYVERHERKVTTLTLKEGATPSSVFSAEYGLNILGKLAFASTSYTALIPHLRLLNRKCLPQGNVTFYVSPKDRYRLLLVRYDTHLDSIAQLITLVEDQLQQLQNEEGRSLDVAIEAAISTTRQRIGQVNEIARFALRTITEWSTLPPPPPPSTPPSTLPSRPPSMPQMMKDYCTVIDILYDSPADLPGHNENPSIQSFRRLFHEAQELGAFDPAVRPGLPEHLPGVIDLIREFHQHGFASFSQPAKP